MKAKRLLSFLCERVICEPIKMVYGLFIHDMVPSPGITNKKSFTLGLLGLLGLLGKVPSKLADSKIKLIKCVQAKSLSPLNQAR